MAHALDIRHDAALDRHWAMARAFRVAHTGEMAQLLGPSYETLPTDAQPFTLGGAPGVGIHRAHLPGVVYATVDLVGAAPWFRARRPRRNAQGLYELMIATRRDDVPASDLLRHLGRRVFERAFEPGQTAPAAPFAPPGATVTAVLFHDYARYKLGGLDCGLLLGVGITERERTACAEGRQDDVLAALTRSGEFPYTDWTRDSVL